MASANQYSLTSGNCSVARCNSGSASSSLGLKVNAGHGLTYHNVKAIAAIPE
ncbi:pyridoxine 5'-phosphate synthase, partial [Escherichia coli]|uniref:pyridoxine 5'-phosphate synthase n=1 Tax=Escherichia coli TaxID=562 RepID=UPI001BD37551